MITSTLVSNSTVAYTLEVNEKVSTTVPSRMPAFFTEEYPTLIEFMKAYYRFQQDQKEGYTERVESIKDIDSIGQKYLEAFYRNFAPDMPVFPYISMADFLRNAKKFYVSRGSEESYKYLFRIMFGEEITIKYPRENMLRASSGRWKQDVSVYIQLDTGEFNELSIGKRILVKGADGSSISLKIQRLDERAFNFYEVFVENFISQQVLAGDKVFFDYNGASGVYQTQGEIVSTANRITILDEGSGFNLGDEFTVTSPSSGDFLVRIVSVTPTKGVKKVEFQSFPLEVNAPFDFTMTSANGDDAELRFEVGTVNRYSGFYENTDGFLSDSNKLQDNFYYQVFSYVISSQVQNAEYEALVNRVLHPAGTVMFGEYQLVSEVELDVTTGNEFSSSLNEVDPIPLYDLFERVFTANRAYSDTIVIADAIQLTVQKVFSDTLAITNSGTVVYYEAGDYVDLSYTLDTIYTMKSTTSASINN